jgi:hypothetical protein
MSITNTEQRISRKWRSMYREWEDGYSTSPSTSDLVEEATRILGVTVTDRGKANLVTIIERGMEVDFKGLAPVARKVIAYCNGSETVTV